MINKQLPITNNQISVNDQLPNNNDQTNSKSVIWNLIIGHCLSYGT